MNERGPIYVWRYVLQSRTALNAVSERRTFEGALLRIGDGFGCLHPWPSLGDPGLDELLQLAASGDCEHPLLVPVFAMAALDGRYRQMQRPAFDPLRLRAPSRMPVPFSHATVPDPSDALLEEMVRRGFRMVKIKGNKEFGALSGKLDAWSRRWPELKWRIDFNEVLSVTETIRFAACLTDHALERIDFLEDPCRYDPAEWNEIRRRTGIQLALDRGEGVVDPAADVLVVKPMRQRSGALRDDRCRIVVTSNMDHPLGQCYAAHEADVLWTRLGKIDVGGLQTQDLFEPDEFSERLGPASPKFQFPGGTGLGFDDLLEKLPWKRLN